MGYAGRHARSLLVQSLKGRSCCGCVVCWLSPSVGGGGAVGVVLTKAFEIA